MFDYHLANMALFPCQDSAARAAHAAHRASGSSSDNIPPRRSSGSGESGPVCWKSLNVRFLDLPDFLDLAFYWIILGSCNFHVRF